MYGSSTSASCFKIAASRASKDAPEDDGSFTPFEPAPDDVSSDLGGFGTVDSGYHNRKSRTIGGLFPKPAVIVRSLGDWMNECFGNRTAQSEPKLLWAGKRVAQTRWQWAR